MDPLNDPNRLSNGPRKVDVLAPDEFAGTLNVGLAALKGVYAGKLKLEDIRPPEHCKMVADGRGKQGFMRDAGTLDLLPKDRTETIVKYAGDIHIGAVR